MKISIPAYASKHLVSRQCVYSKINRRLLKATFSRRYRRWLIDADEPWVVGEHYNKGGKCGR